MAIDLPGALMKRLWRMVAASVLSLALLLVLAWFTLPYWLPAMLNHWLPASSRITLSQPQLSVRAASVRLADVRYLAGNCPLAQLRNLRLHYAQGWQLTADSLHIDDRCLSKLPASNGQRTPFSLSQWQARLPRAALRISQVKVDGLADYAGSLRVDISAHGQHVDYTGKQLTLNISLQGNALTADHIRLALPVAQSSLVVQGSAALTLTDAGLPARGRLTAQLPLPASLPAKLALPASVSLPPALRADLHWQGDTGQLLVNASDAAQPLLDLPWQVTASQLKIYDGRWHYPYQLPLSGRLALSIDHWRCGLERALITARLSVLSKGAAGKANSVLTVGPGHLSLTDNHLPVRLTGQANYQALQFYATMPGELRGALRNPQLQLLPGALLWSRGQLISGLNIDEIRLPLAGVSVSAQGVNGPLQAILRGRDAISGEFALHLDGRAENFFPDQGLWQWRYWGQGSFDPMRSRWKTRGSGEWRDNRVILSALVTDFDKLEYAGLHIGATRLTLHQPLRWVRDARHPRFTGGLQLSAASAQLPHAGSLPPSVLNFSVQGSHPDDFLFTGNWQAGEIGPIRVNGRWDGTRLRGEAWWAAQPLGVFQPLLPPALKMTLNDGQFYAQTAFSAAPQQGLQAGGHLVVRHGGGWLEQTHIQDVNFILPFVLKQNRWQLGPRQPVTLRIGQIDNQFHLQKLTADLRGWYPWSDTQPLVLSNVSVAGLGGELTMQQWRLPQREPLLLRLKNLETSQFTSALNIKTFALSGRLDGALPVWLGQSHWLIRRGWLSNPAALTLRMNDEVINGMVKNNGAAASAINWLRYLEINPRSWISVDLDNQGALMLKASIRGTGEVDGKRGSVRLNYHHQDNIFALWRSLRFGDNLQNWLMRQLPDPATCCQLSHEQRQK